MDESELRADADKWETTRHASRRLRASTLIDPVFDIHYNPREGGHDTCEARSIRYAMIISISAEEMPDFYSRVWRRYRHQLEQLKPIIEIPLRP